MNKISREKIIPAALGLVAGWISVAGILYWYFETRLAQLSQQQAGLQIATLPVSSAVNSRVFVPTGEFQQAAQNSVNAVVYISAIGKGDDFHDLFSGISKGTGSGVIISPDGYIITNYHVVQHADEITVTLNNKTEYSATLAGKDPNTDLAILKIDAENLPVLKFGDSDNVGIGQWVLAVGNPFNLTSTVTAGIVSAKARNIGVMRSQQRSRSKADYSIESFIQTDAAVNPGNSGGALVSLTGELIGINTAIATESGSFQGYSFAIPSNLVKKIVSDLLAYGVVQRGFIGVSIQDLNARTAREYGLDSKQLQGAYVAALSPNGAAQAAGIREGDLITEIGGKSVRSASELQEQVANYKPGDAIEVTILRAGKTQKLKVVLRNINGSTELLKSETDTKNMTMSKQTENRENIESVLGARLQAIDMLAMKQLDIEYGVKVQQLESGGALARAGVPDGYVIIKINHQPVRDLDDVKQILKRAGRTIYLEGVSPSGRKRAFMVLLD